MLVEDLDISGVGSLSSEHRHTERTPSDGFGEQTVVDHRQPEAPELNRMVGGPEAHLLDLGLSCGDAFGQHVGIAVEKFALEGDHLPHHEVVDHGQTNRHLLRHLEIHGNTSESSP